MVQPKRHTDCCSAELSEGGHPGRILHVLVQATLRAFVDRAGILVLASRSVGLLTQFCTRAIRLSHGEIVADGPIDQVVTGAV
jgi:ABC-type phosphate/phosphonate transport system ATPase subunit